jgi:hypothetical protein
MHPENIKFSKLLSVQPSYSSPETCTKLQRIMPLEYHIQRTIQTKYYTVFIPRTITYAQILND